MVNDAQREGRPRKRRSETERLYGFARAVYADLVSVRPHLTGLPPATPSDLENASRALGEVLWYLTARPPGEDAREPPLQPADRDRLLAAAARRDDDLFVLVVALVASKLVRQREGDGAQDQLLLMRHALDALTFDFRTPKRTTLAAFRALKADIEDRARYVRNQRPDGYEFSQMPERYADRTNKSERADQFFKRVYGPHVPRGLTQADLRRVDSRFYNVFHVWCARHERKMSGFIPAGRLSRRG